MLILMLASVSKGYYTTNRMFDKDIITPHLAESETVVWSSQPRWSTFSRRYKIVARIVLILIGLVLTLGIITQVDSSRWWIPALFSLIYFSLFVFMIFALGQRTKEGTRYVVTDRRLISVFNRKNASTIIGRILPAGTKMVELPISDIKEILIEESNRLNSNLVAVIFANYVDFILPPYSFNDSEGVDHKVRTAYNWMPHTHKPYGYAQDSMFGFFDITKEDADEIVHIVTTAHRMGTEEGGVSIKRKKISSWRDRYIHGVR